MGRNRFNSVCAQPLEGVMHRRCEDKKVTPASATQEGFLPLCQGDFFAK